MAVQMSASPSAKATNAVTAKLDVPLRLRLLKHHDPKVNAAAKRLDECWAEKLQRLAEVGQAGGPHYAEGRQRLACDLAEGRCQAADAQLRIAIDARLKALSEPPAMPEGLGRRIVGFTAWCRRRAEQERYEGSVKAGPMGDKSMVIQSLRIRGDEKKLAVVLADFDEMHREVKGHQRRAFAYDDLGRQALELWLAPDPEALLAELTRRFEPVEKEADHVPV
jgi:hypothetical protein